MANATGTRDEPLKFDDLDSAFAYSRAIFQKVWAQLHPDVSEDGVYEIYPGGRNIFWPRNVLRSERRGGK